MICPNKDCRRNVSPFDTTCPNCGASLKSNPVGNYEKKANDIANKAAGKTDALREDIRSGFTENSSFGGIKAKEQKKFEMPNLSNSNDLRNRSEFNGEKLADHSAKGAGNEKPQQWIDTTEVEKEHELRLKLIKKRKEVKVKEMYHNVFGVPYVTGAEDYAPRASITDFIYRMENGDCFTVPNLIEPYITDKSPLTVNAYACYHEDANRYEISLFDGYLNFLLGVEAYFTYKNEKILTDLIELYHNKRGEISAHDVLHIMYMNSDHRYRFNDAELVELVENAFLPCFEVISHELGHVCLGHCRLDSTANRDVETIRINERQADGFASAIINSFSKYSEDAKKAIFLAYVKNELVWTLKDKLSGHNKPFTHPLSEERLKNAIRNNDKIAQELEITEVWVDKIINKLLRKIKELPQ